MLCDRCQVLSSSVNPSQDNVVPHHETVGELSACANAGCLLCRMIHKEMEEKFKKSVTTSYRMSVKTIQDKGIEVSFRDPLANEGKVGSALKHFANSHDESTGSKDTFQLATAWLEECLEHHEICSATTIGDLLLPHRVIDVGIDHGLSEPYLLETAPGQVGKYVTLSHCWGGGTPIKTTTENIHRHRKEIKLGELSPTFRDAVIVARNIGCRYLWIDSLCIIQNDGKDWEVEAVMMHQYYKNSLLTIAAASGNGSEAGLFKDRDQLRNRPCELQITNIDSSTQQVCAYTNDMSFELKRSCISASYKPIPLYSRAWVFQEQALSPRTLSYARDRISWRCQETIFDERVPFAQHVEEFIRKDESASVVSMKGDPRTTDATIAELQRKWIFPKRNPNPNHNGKKIGLHEEGCFLPDDDFLIDWSHIIQDYTQRDMTYHSDKLIAIQGIADAVASIIQRTYFAGIWIDSPRSIFMGLLWSSQKRSSKPLQRVDAAPSWSWASTDGEVTWFGHMLCRLEARIQILNLSCDGSPVKASGELEMEGSVKLGKTEEDYGFSVVDWPDESMDTPSGRSGSTNSIIKWRLDMPETPVSLDEKLEIGASIWFIELAAGEIHGQARKKYVHCLVLVREGEGKPRFRRVGYSMWNKEKWESPELPETKKIKLTII